MNTCMHSRRIGRSAGWLTGLIVALAASGCGGALYAYPDSVSAWDAGRTDDAVAAATAAYVNVRDGNDLAERDVRAAVDDAFRTLDETPVVPSGGFAAPAFGNDSGASAIDRSIQADLLSGKATASLRAIKSVAGLGLRHHAKGLLALVFRRGAIASDGALLDEVSPALRTVATKRAALDALETLSKP